MTFEEFLKRVAPKFGANLAFDAARDARFTVLENIIIKKELSSKDEMTREYEKQLEELAEKISKIPLPPQQ